MHPARALRASRPASGGDSNPKRLIGERTARFARRRIGGARRGDTESEPFAIFAPPAKRARLVVSQSAGFEQFGDRVRQGVGELFDIRNRESIRLDTDVYVSAKLGHRESQRVSGRERAERIQFAQP